MEWHNQGKRLDNLRENIMAKNGEYVIIAMGFEGLLANDAPALPPKDWFPYRIRLMRWRTNIQQVADMVTKAFKRWSTG